MTTLSTYVVTSDFPGRLVASFDRACDDAQATADANGCPCGIWERGGWYAVCELAPELIEPQPELDGWRLHAVVDPAEAEAKANDPHERAAAKARQNDFEATDGRDWT